MSSDENWFFFSHKEFDVSAQKWLRSLWNDQDFVDVTLATADDRHINVHKVILSSASPFFRNILLKNVHTNPLIYLKDILYEDLSPILEFVYNGECGVANERLENFLVSAKELGITGLNQDIIETNHEAPQSILSTLEYISIASPVLKETIQTENIDKPEAKLEENIESCEYNRKTESKELFYVIPDKLKVEKAPKVCCHKCGKRYAKLGNLLAHMKENIHKKRKLRMYICNVCNKEVGNLSQHLKKHEKEPIQCDLCSVKKVSQLPMERHTKMRHLAIACPICNMKLEGGLDFKKHRDNRHRPNKIRKCQYCSKELTTRSGMRTHVKNCIELRNTVSQMNHS